MVDSISKTPVTFEAAATVMADAFGSQVRLTELVECKEGWFNAAYLATLDDGRRCVLKIAPPPAVTVLTYEHDIMTTEVTAMRLVRERTSAPVPEVLWWDTSCRRVPSPLFVMECCEGTLLGDLRATLDAEQQRVVDVQLAHILREVNAITNPTFGLLAPGSPSFTCWSDAFGHLVGSILSDGERASVPLPASSAVLLELVAERSAALDEVTVPSLVHWDLWDTNVFVDAQTLDVLGVIDFERAMWGDPLMEAQFLSKRHDVAFLDAYGVDLLGAPGAADRRALYDMYLYLVMIIESTYRQYPTPDIETYARTRLTKVLQTLGA